MSGAGRVASPVAMNAPGPLPDRIAVALWRAGSAHAAVELAHAAIARGDARWMVCRIAIDRIQRGESPDEGGELPVLDLPLVASMLERGHLVEAYWVLRGAAIGGPVAQRLVRTLEEALAPFPSDADPSFDAVRKLVRAGQSAAALRALEEVVRESPAPPAWLTSRQRALASLVRGLWRHDADPVEPVTRDTVLARIRARDLPAALEAARSAGASELAEVLARLLAATERVFTDSIPDSDDPETVPMQGHRLAEFHVRMGVLTEAERSYRSMLRARPDDERARTMLTDVVALRRALGEAPEPVPPRTASVSFLNKNAPRAMHGQAWSSGRYGAWGDEQENDSTANLQASQEAELLLKLGRAQQALDVYRILAIRHPKQQAYRKRIGEIEALIARRMTPVDGEVTVRQDLSHLRLEAVPTNTRVVISDFPSFDDDEPPTMVDRLRDGDED